MYFKLEEAANGKKRDHGCLRDADAENQSQKCDEHLGTSMISKAEDG